MRCAARATAARGEGDAASAPEITQVNVAIPDGLNEASEPDEAPAEPTPPELTTEAAPELEVGASLDLDVDSPLLSSLVNAPSRDTADSGGT